MHLHYRMEEMAEAEVEVSVELLCRPSPCMLPFQMYQQRVLRLLPAN